MVLRGAPPLLSSDWQHPSGVLSSAVSRENSAGEVLSYFFFLFLNLSTVFSSTPSRRAAEDDDFMIFLFILIFVGNVYFYNKYIKVIMTRELKFHFSILQKAKNTL